MPRGPEGGVLPVGPLLLPGTKPAAMAGGSKMGCCPSPRPSGHRSSPTRTSGHVPGPDVEHFLCWAGRRGPRTQPGHGPFAQHGLWAPASLGGTKTGWPRGSHGWWQPEALAFPGDLRGGGCVPHGFPSPGRKPLPTSLLLVPAFLGLTPIWAEQREHQGGSGGSEKTWGRHLHRDLRSERARLGPRAGQREGQAEAPDPGSPGRGPTLPAATRRAPRGPQARPALCGGAPWAV